MYSACVRSVMMYAAETWTAATINPLRRNDGSVKAKDYVCSNSFLSKLGTLRTSLSGKEDYEEDLSTKTNPRQRKTCFKIDYDDDAHI